MNETSCSNCIGACCVDTWLQLNRAEHRHLERAGTILREILPIIDFSYPYNEEKDGLCMGWVEMSLSLAMDALMEENETHRTYLLTLAGSARTLRNHEGLFAIQGKCGYLGADKSCLDYVNRPSICRAFEMGGERCLSLREQAGVAIELSVKQ